MVAAESLFNDGIGVVLFVVLLDMFQSGASMILSNALMLFVQEAFGGAAIGFVAGYAVRTLLRNAGSYHVEILLTLALVMASYAGADAVHASGPMAVVVAGLIVGAHNRNGQTSPEGQSDLSIFWELIDDILNAVLFLLIGMQVMVMQYSRPAVLAALLLIPITLVARLASVGSVIGLFSFRRKFPKAMLYILTWGGLRGGLAVAMALALPPGIVHDRIVLITYVVVLFSIVVQGTTTGALVRRLGLATT